MARTAKSKGKLAFSVDARHIRQLGRELVGDRLTALSELVKNAYDADARHVTLRFFNAAEESGGALEIEDDGQGMSLNELKSGWMRISTPVKENEPVTPKYRRARAGQKGIGRFATETLGSRLTLSTTRAGSPQRIVLSFDWVRAYAAGRDLSKVENPYTVEAAPRSEKGTRLRIEGLHEAWGSTARQQVLNSIRLLQPPFPTAGTRGKRRKIDPGFTVSVEVDGRKERAAEESHLELIQNATSRMTLDVDKAGRAVLKIRGPLFGVRGQHTYRKRYRDLKGISVTGAYFVYRANSVGSISVKLARDLGFKFGGVRVYRDGFRVPPYGEQGNDWLKLDELARSRSTVLVPIGNNNWFVQVNISKRSNPELVDTASREGLVQNQTFAELADLLRDSLVRTATRIGHARARKVSTSESRPGPRSRKAILDDARKQLDAAAAKELPAEVSTRVRRLIAGVLDLESSGATGEDQSERAYVEGLLDEIELLRVLASLGTSMAVFSHEVKSVLNRSEGALALLRQELPTGDGLVEELTDAESAIDSLRSLSTYIDATVGESRRRKRSPQPLSAVIRRFVEELQAGLAHGVRITYSVEPRGLRTTAMTRSELDSVLMNLLTNSVKAMDEDGRRKRKVHISAAPEGSDVLIRFQDTGKGIPAEMRASIFEPFVTNRESEVTELGVGTGLGLKIVSDISEAYGGSVSVGTPGKGFRTCIEFRIPRWERQTHNG